MNYEYVVGVFATHGLNVCLPISLLICKCIVVSTTIWLELSTASLMIIFLLDTQFKHKKRSIYMIETNQYGSDSLLTFRYQKVSLIMKILNYQNGILLSQLHTILTTVALNSYSFKWTYHHEYLLPIQQNDKRSVSVLELAIIHIIYIDVCTYITNRFPNFWISVKRIRYILNYHSCKVSAALSWRVSLYANFYISILQYM